MDVSLPQRLQERLRWEVAADPAVSPEGFVLYWMHHALRGHENPALDTAIHLARQNDLSLLVYQGLCENHPHASDRHHAFILQGARDVQRELAERGIRYVFHLQRCGSRGPHLKSLVRAAAIMVTEEMPVEPILGWLERLRGSTTTPILSVDTSCVVPMPTIGRLYTDATEFRRATEPEFACRVARRWSDEPPSCASYRGRLPFEPLDLQDIDLARLIGECSIDHTVAPVVQRPGGTRAGYARWEAIKEGGDSRSFPASSRIAPYLHYGMISPLRIARQAQQAGAKEFLGGLLARRELAHHFCFHVRDSLATFDALPPWARETLQTHARDPREADLGWETWARARTGDASWDACQRSLLRHGELSYEARTEWGKGFLLWTDEPRHAWQLALDLNQRYALDGPDPASYGALLRSFGQFDRPVAPERPVLGTVRPREPDAPPGLPRLADSEPAAAQAVIPHQPRIAVIGAGMAGLIAARTWADLGVEVTVFERSQRIGGRMATRHVGSGASFDHGAQYFTVRDDGFARYVRSWIQAGIAAPWNARIVELRAGRIGETKGDQPRYVGVPHMRAIAEHLAADLVVATETAVGPLAGQPGQWRLAAEDGRDLGQFEFVIANCPPRQAAELFAVHQELAGTIRAIPMAPCWAVMAEWEQSLGLGMDAAFVQKSPLGWIARNNSKPQRSGNETWVLHATAEWSADHLQECPDEVTGKLLAAFAAASGAQMGRPLFAAAHRWRSALPVQTPQSPCLWEPTAGLGACGDWCGGPRIEGAFLSGAAMAGCLLRHLTIDRHPSRSCHS